MMFSLLSYPFIAAQGLSEGERGERGEREEPGTEHEGDERSAGELAGEAAAGPSMGPHTDLSQFLEGREESLHKAEEASDVDAMGRDKRRQIVGGTYGPTKTRLIVTFTATIAVIGGIGAGLYLLAKNADQPPEQISREAPWAESDAPQNRPAKLQ
jgi:hypothetical protein